MTAKVYRAIATATADMAEHGIAKTRTNDVDGYKFRGIDDFYEALSPVLSRHKLCMLPRVLERSCAERRGERGDMLLHIVLKVAYDIVSADDGSVHTVDVFAEALDSGDKATNKAMSAAYKYAAMQVFCIPLGAGSDAEEASPKIHAGPAVAEPVNGWDQWVEDVASMAGQCVTVEAIERLQRTYKSELRALSLYDARKFKQLGEIITAKRRGFTGAPPNDRAPPLNGLPPAKPRNAN